MYSWLSTLVHYLFVSTCDFCKQKLSGNDFNRICLRCVVRLENTRKVIVCVKCFQPLKYLYYPSHREDQGINPGKICDTCANEETPLVENRSLFLNDGLPQKLIYDFKFSPHSSYSPIVVYWSLKKLKLYLESFDVFVPIPLGKKGMYEREFCQVTKVTGSLAKHLKKPMVKAIIRNESKYQLAQHSLSAKEREITVKEKYRYLDKYNGHFNRKKTLIIDDIYTTGSTLKNAAYLFKNNNDKVEVSSFTFLRTYLK